VADTDDRRRADPAAVSAEAPRKLPEAEDFPASGPNSLAAPGPRFGARGLDLFLVAIPAAVIAALTLDTPGDQVQWDIPPWTGWVVLGLGLVYEAIAVAVWGRTVGKWIFGLRVARYTDGKRPRPDQALLRALVPWAAFALPMPLGLAGMLALWSTGAGGSLHRGVPDQAGGTIVVATR
jgi:uncharacterized RDD family membrane protein YckC